MIQKRHLRKDNPEKWSKIVQSYWNCNFIRFIQFQIQFHTKWSFIFGANDRCGDFFFFGVLTNTGAKSQFLFLFLEFTAELQIFTSKCVWVCVECAKFKLTKLERTLRGESQVKISVFSYRISSWVGCWY